MSPAPSTPTPTPIENLPDVPTQDESVRSAPENSLLNRLKQKRERIREERRLELDIPGYNGELVARYRPLPWEVLRKIGEKSDKSKHPKKELMAHADTIAQACEGIFVRDGKRLIPVAEAFGLSTDDEVRYDHNLAKAFEVDASTARQVVFAIFNDELAVTAHHYDLAEWMQTTDREDDEDFLGESVRTR